MRSCRNILRDAVPAKSLIQAVVSSAVGFYSFVYFKLSVLKRNIIYSKYDLLLSN